MEKMKTLTLDGTTFEVVDEAARAEVASLSEEIVDLKGGLTLGIASDGLIYLFVDGKPVGTGVPQGQSGDVFGYVDENNTIVLTGNLADGTYTLKYEMENGNTLDIGGMVLDSRVYYSVKNTLTYCTTNNKATKVAEGSSYKATITANSGYDLKSVSATMGGAAVSVSNGVVNIASVTGDIVITAVAEEKAKEPTNFVVYNSTNTTDQTIWINSARLNSSGVVVSDTNEATGYGSPAVTNFIEVQNGDTIEYNGMYIGNRVLTTFNSSKSFLTAAPPADNSNVKDYTAPKYGQGSFTINNASVKYIRMACYLHSSYGDIWVKIKRNGEYL